VEFYPPDELTSAEIGLLFDGKVDDRDLLSMILYWADKGYLKIQEMDEENYLLIKQSDLPIGPAQYTGARPFRTGEYKKFENTLFNGIFARSDRIMIAQLGAEFSGAFLEAKKQLAEQYSHEGLRGMYTQASMLARNISLVLSVLPVIGFVVLILMEDLPYVNRFFYVAPILLFVIIAAIILKMMKYTNIGISSMIGVVVTLIRMPRVWAGIVLMLSSGSVISGNLFLAIFVLISTLLCIVFAVLAKKRTPYYTKTLGRILGLKKFIETADLAQINMLVNENPEYYYRVLSYAWAFDLTDAWSEKFSGIHLTPPDWYSSYTTMNMFNAMYFSGRIHRYMGGMETQTPTEGANSGGGKGSGGLFGGFSIGGGISGGGFGGGGGGRW
jgi:uncharacterized membrane protein YgcG